MFILNQMESIYFYVSGMKFHFVLHFVHDVHGLVKNFETTTTNFCFSLLEKKQLWSFFVKQMIWMALVSQDR